MPQTMRCRPGALFRSAPATHHTLGNGINGTKDLLWICRGSYYYFFLYYAGDFLLKVGHFGTLPGPWTSRRDSSSGWAHTSNLVRPFRSHEVGAMSSLLFYDMATGLIESAGIGLAA
jgi:hypothetical protein